MRRRNNIVKRMLRRIIRKWRLQNKRYYKTAQVYSGRTATWKLLCYSLLSLFIVSIIDIIYYILNDLGSMGNGLIHLHSDWNIRWYPLILVMISVIMPFIPIDGISDISPRRNSSSWPILCYDIQYWSIVSAVVTDTSYHCEGYGWRTQKR